ncbi:MAG: 16S rRNA processing protein RimM [Geobacter sp.]|nr:16S rRNA processing protein RimM [Geobacter sp.]
MSRDDGLVLIGKITKPQGIRGELRVVPYSGDPESILHLSTFITKGPGGALETHELAKAVQHGSKTVISLRQFDNINQVQHLVGREIYVRRSQLPELSEGEYYWFDLVGLSVMSEAGEPLGELSEIMSTGSNDVYVVRSGKREILVPALEDVVLDVDLDRRIMKVSLPEGLQD